MKQEVAAPFHGAVLIGRFEGSRWRGGCGEGLGDLNGRFRLEQHFFLGFCKVSKAVGVGHDTRTTVFGD